MGMRPYTPAQGILHTATPQAPRHPPEQCKRLSLVDYLCVLFALYQGHRLSSRLHGWLWALGHCLLCLSTGAEIGLDEGGATQWPADVDQGRCPLC